MKLRDFFKPNKSKQIVGKYSYSLLEYKTPDGSFKEIIWNGTNINPPSYILSRDKKFKLFLNTSFSKEYPNYTPKKGERFLTYKSAEEYIKERRPVLQLYWDKNYLDCQKTYSSYEEYFAIACNSMHKNRISLKIK
jgi:hypothetical protein